MVTIDFKLADDIAQKARTLGILSDDKLSELIEAEINRKRQEAWASLRETMDTIQPEFRDQHSDLSEDDVLEMIQEVVDEVRSDIYEKRFTQSSTKS